MADRNDPGERLAALERHAEWAKEEITGLRAWRHDRVAGILQTVIADEAGKRLGELEGFKNRLIGMALMFGFISGIAGGFIAKAIHG